MSLAISTTNLRKTYRAYQAATGSGPLGRIKGFFSKRYTEVVGLEDFNLTIEGGEAIGLLGPNGAGKTTLIKILTGILTPTSGCVACLGMSPTRDRMRYTRDIGVVMGQRSLLWNNIPVMESLKLYKEVYRLSNKDFLHRIDEFCDMFDNREILNRPVRQLSLGQRMRAELMAAMLHSPKILFLDEPSIGLDVVSKKRLFEHLRQMREETRCTIILTSHDLHEVEGVAERVILLESGRTRFDGQIDSLLKVDTKTVRLGIHINTDDQQGVFHFCSEHGLGEPEIAGDRFLVLPVSTSERKAMTIKILKLPEVESVQLKPKSLEEVFLEMYGGR